jgi:outer membrane protein OmpA-like peptidoglycan-associated protein
MVINILIGMTSFLRNMKSFWIWVILLSSARVLAQPPKKFNVYRLDSSINHTYEEIQPILSRDGQTMYFVRSLNPKNEGGKDSGQDIWVCKKTGDTTWSKPESLGFPINNKENNGIIGISADGKTMLISNVYLKKKMDPGISISTKGDDGKWSAPTPLLIKDFTIQKGYLGGYWLPNEKAILMTMKSDGSIGREDLYITFKEEDGSYSKPLNLGNTVNTVGFEIAPFYMEEDSMLYFASNSHEGSGDADIFRTKRLDNTWTKWTKPENLGPFFNGEGFDAYFFIDRVDSTIYFGKENPENNYTDLYYTHLSNLKEALKRQGEKKKKGDNVVQNPNSTPGTSPASLAAQEAKAQADAERELDKRERIIIDEFSNVLFDFAKFDLRPEGRQRLDKLFDYLMTNPTVGVELIGHADSIDTELVNLILSVKRSEECKQYLINKGISKRRILTHGFGKQLPVSTNITSEGRQLNRRCEINILPDNRAPLKMEFKPANMGNETGVKDKKSPKKPAPKKK